MSQNNSTWKMSDSRHYRLVWGDQPERMDPEFKKEWIAALRSNEYRQGIGALCLLPFSFSEDQTPQYCCLGVAGDLKVKSNPEKYSWDGTSFDGNRRILIVLDDDKQPQGNSSLLPLPAIIDMGIPSMPWLFADSVLAKWEIHDENGMSVLVITDLASLNDNGFTFDQIADLIEYFL